MAAARAASQRKAKKAPADADGACGGSADSADSAGAARAAALVSTHTVAAAPRAMARCGAVECLGTALIIHPATSRGLPSPTLPATATHCQPSLANKAARLTLIISAVAIVSTLSPTPLHTSVLGCAAPLQPQLRVASAMQTMRRRRRARRPRRQQSTHLDLGCGFTNCKPHFTPPPHTPLLLRQQIRAVGRDRALQRWMLWHHALPLTTQHITPHSPLMLSQQPMFSTLQSCHAA